MFGRARPAGSLATDAADPLVEMPDFGAGSAPPANADAPPVNGDEAGGLPELSMGTSQDYLVAVEEGATIVRLGTVLYRG